MNNHYNPFKENRAEQMRDLWKYYVPFPGIDSAGKPIVVQGGRGSGKTMFFQCNSWRQVLSKIRKAGEPSTNLFSCLDFIGLYYRVDTTFVSSMNNREETDWNAIFETYFSICILQEILDLISELENDMPINESLLNSFVSDFSKRLNPSSTSDSLFTFREETEIFLDCIEDKINGIENSPLEMRLVNANRYITNVCKTCNKLFNYNLPFKIFIDEYETLQEYQQKIVNTLIKHSSQNVIYNIGLRPHGMKTNATVSETEIIDSPHDYEMITLRINSEKYNEMLIEICKKRIALGKEQGKIPQSASDNISFYLGSYNIDEELKRIENASFEAPHKKELRKLINEYGKEENLSYDCIQECCTLLCDDTPLINSRLHYSLLCKHTAYTPTISMLKDAYLNKSDKYKDWMHNRKFGLIFMLCKEFKKDKLYYGFDVFSALSSNIVRYFLELCEQAFTIAFLDDYQWDIALSCETQTEAAKYVSEYKIVDIAGYEPYGKQLRIFIQVLGQIFYKLHTTDLNTLGEPEPNHFSTNDLSMPINAKKLISSAVMWNVLLEGEPTKRKSSKLSPETIDYYINKIYVPYFGISYRNQRKIQIDVNTLIQLLSGDESIAKQGFHSFFQKEGDLFMENSENQLSLFEY